MNGKISAADLKGPMQGKTVLDLKSAMNNSQTYVNILTRRGPVKIILPKNQTITDVMNTTGTSTWQSDTGSEIIHGGKVQHTKALAKI